MKQRLGMKYGVCLALLASGVATQGQNVIINEIMYHPSSQDAREEYVELLNAGATNVMSLRWVPPANGSFTTI